MSQKECIHTDRAPAAVGPYSQAVASSGLLFTSGQIALDPATGAIVEGGIEAQTRQVFENIRAVLEAAGYTMDDILKTTVFLTDIADFTVVNEIYATYFAGSFPARSAVEVGALPKGALIEIETICAKHG